MRNAWHAMDIEQIANKLETSDATGLTRKQAVSRYKKLNIRHPDAVQPLFIPTQHSLWRYIGKMVLDPIMILTFFVAAIAFFFEQYVLGAVVILIMLCNAVFCAIASNKARDVWHTLQLYSNPMVKVIRGGKLYSTDSRNVVPGDLLLLSAGDVCPADVRLLPGNLLKVKQYLLSDNEKNNLVFQSVTKSGDVTYLPDTEKHNPDYENIVYAGSVIEQGFARGIVVETGHNTFVGAIHGKIPGTEKPTEPDSISFIRRYFTRFSTVQAFLLVPLTVIMTVTLRESLSFAECFLTALALCCTAIAEHAVALADIIRATGIDLAASQKENAALAIVKNNTASDRLCEMTDLFLLDSSAISDGKYHLESVYAGGSIYNNTELNNPDVFRLASDLYVYRSAARPPEMSSRDTFDAGLTAPIDALIKHVGVDTEALDLIKKDCRLTCDRDMGCVKATLGKQDYEIYLAQSESILQQCTHVLSAEQSKVFDDSEHIALRTLCRIYRESGYRIFLVVTKTLDCVTLMGVLAFAHRPGYRFSECCNELITGGVRISAFMPYTAENMKILTDSGLVRDESTDVLTAIRAENEGLDLYVAYGSYRAYLGFTNDQIAELIEKLKKRGNRIASFCVDNELQSLHEATDLRITCDAIEYRSSKTAASLYEKMPVDGKSFSACASQNTRRSSDVILRRAGDQGGGLHGIMTGRRYAFAVNHNLANMMTYLITVQFFRAVLVIVPALFGTHTLSAVSLLISGLVLDVAAVILFAFAMPNSASVASAYPIMRRLEKPIAYNTANIVSACVSALMLWLGLALLQIFGVISTSACTGLSFVSTYLLQATVFVITLVEYTKKQGRTKPKPVLIGIMIAYLLLLAACIWIPDFNVLTGAAYLTPICILLSPLAAAIYGGLYAILSSRGLNLHK